MNADKRKKIIYAVFVVAVAWGIYNFTGKNSRDLKQEPVSPPVRAEIARSTPPARAIDIEKYESLPWGQDPFLQPGDVDRPDEVAAESPRWVLGGILYSRDNPSAVINNRIVRTGDSVNGAIIVDIMEKSVALDKDGLQFKLTLSKGIS
nr:hypothetical protein [candidate division Zixibacteria bacterium]